MFKTIIASAAIVLSIFTATTASAYEVDVHKAYRVVDRNTGEILSDISFNPTIEWVNGFPYVSMVEFDVEDRAHRNLYDYPDIILEPINPENIIMW